MTRCLKHSKDTLGACNWCGKRLCKLCIAVTEGRKMYCESCSEKLGKS